MPTVPPVSSREARHHARVAWPIPAITGVVLLLGCGSGTRLPDDPVAEARRSRDQAKEACEKREPKRAEAAATSAERLAQLAWEQADRLRGAKPAPDAETEVAKTAEGVAREVTRVAREARKFADLAREEAAFAEKVNSLKAKAYRTARKAAVLALFQGLALAAEQAEGKDLSQLPKPVAESARCAADAASQYLQRQPKPDGSPDWPGIAADMRTLSTSPPPTFHLYLAVGFCLLAQPGLALYEIEMLDPAALTDSKERLGQRIVHVVVCHQNGYPRIAVRELESLAAEEGMAKESGPELEAGMYFLLAWLSIQDGKYAEAETQIVHASQLYPNNPIAVFLTGERLAANGEYEKAAESLESMAVDPEDQWLAARVTKRARELRDRKEQAEPLLCNATFACELTRFFIAKAARKSEAAQKLDQTLQSAKAQARAFLGRLPGIGGESAGVPPDDRKPGE